MLGERIFCAGLVALGIFVVWPRATLPFGTLHEPGAGFFPAAVAAALILFSAIALGTEDTQMDKEPLARRGVVGMAAVVFAMVGYAWLLPAAGFIACTVALLMVVFRLGSVAWGRAAVAATVASIACYLVFTRLGMPLPAGVLGL